jgi:2-haloacid dehalogenase
MMSYRQLAPYPEVPSFLREIHGMKLLTAILSNGEPAMLADATRSAGIRHLLGEILNIETVGIFKPDPRVYHLAEDRLGIPCREMAFVPSNPWDAFGAQAQGFRVFWVNRAGQPAEYCPGEVAIELTDLKGLSNALPRAPK